MLNFYLRKCLMNLTKAIEIENINEKIKFHLIFNQIQLLILYESRRVLFCIILQWLEN